MFRKKGQKSAGSAAALIGMITLLLIAYILFLPPEEREQLLEDDSGNGYYFARPGDKNVTLVNVTSLRLEYVGASDYEHNIPNIYLFETTEGGILETFNPFYIRNGWFDKKENDVSFYITDLANTGNVALSFEAPQAKGKLMISLNGVEIFEYEVIQLNVGPIELKKSLLKEGENILHFSVDGVGIKFWSTNEYSLEDMQITADITDISRQESLNVFTITNEEYYNIENAHLNFYPVCTQESVGRLEIRLNNRVVFSAVPDCEMLNRQEIFTTDLNPGKNTITFKTDRGDYRVELIKVKTELKDVKTFLEYFEVNSSSYEEIQDGERGVVLEIKFVDDREDKKAEININGHLTYLDQRGALYSKRIDSWVEEGARNYIEITPKTVLKIVEIKVMLNEK